VKGIELCESYFKEYGLPMLQEQFPEVLPFLAAGVCGPGSENSGYDDEISRDHDFEPGFLLFLPGEEIVDRRTAFLLERAYAKLPKQWQGVERTVMEPVGGARHGVVRTGEFFRERCGTENGELSLREWLSVPDYALIEVTNGALFLDNYGEVSRIRQNLEYYPEDVRLKKLAGRLLLMAQSGQYNYHRCLQHGETAAAQLAVCEFVRSAMSAIFLLNRRYEPFYKWSFRALRELPLLSGEAGPLEMLITTGVEGDLAEEKYYAIEGIAADVIDVLFDQGITKANCGDLEKHAYSVEDGIGDPGLRNDHILAAV